MPDQGSRPWRGGRVLAAVVALTAASALAGWVLGVPVLTRVFPGYPVFRPIDALGLLGLAAGLDGAVRERRSLSLVGAALALAAAAALLVEIAGDRSAGVEWLLRGAPPGPGEWAGSASSVASAFNLTLGGLALLGGASSRWPPAGQALLGALGAVVAVFSITVLFTYTTDVLSLRASELTGLAVHAAFGYTLAGLGLAVLAWHRELPELSGPFPAWVPWAAGVAVLSTTGIVWQALSRLETDRGTRLLRSQASVARHELLAQLDGAIKQLRQLPAGDTIQPVDADTAAQRTMAEAPAFSAIAWIDSSLAVRTVGRAWHVEVDSAGLAPLLRGNGGPVLAALERGQPTVAIIPRSDGRSWLMPTVPRCGDDGCRPVIGLLRPETLLRAGLAVAVPGYDVSVTAGGRVVYHSADSLPAGSGERAGQAVVQAHGARWEVRVRPAAPTLPLFRSGLPHVVGALGLLVGALLTAMLQVLRASYATAQVAERARLARALESATDGLWEWNLVTGESTRSAAVWSRLGYDPGSVDPQTSAGRWVSLIHPEERARVEQALQKHLSGHSPLFEMEYRIRTGDGGWHWIVERGRVVERDARGRAVRLLGICADVTDRKRADQALADSERRFRVVFDSGFQFESVLDLEGRVLEANRTALEFGGIGIGEVRGVHFWDTPWWRVSPRSRDRLRDACVEAATGRMVQYQDVFTGAGDRRAIVDFSLKPIRDSEGRVTQLLAEGRDITERKRAEDAMRELEAVGTMGRLAARVAHEINNPLAGIQNSFLLIRDAIPPSHQYYPYVGAIEREIARIAAVTRQLYETYRPASESTADSSPPLIISDAVRMLELVNRRSQVRIEVDATGAAGVVPIPSALLRQAVYNLVQNAVEASPTGQAVTVRAWRENGTFWLAVRDRGPGVPVDLRDRIFEPFVTTKEGLATGGMGLGLSLVRRSVQAMGGRIEIHDAEGGGAEFRVAVPVGAAARRNGS